nr:MAG TPA: hypothetical protein [Caudoviricetes sp.]
MRFYLFISRISNSCLLQLLLCLIIIILSRSCRHNRWNGLTCSILYHLVGYSNIVIKRIVFVPHRFNLLLC